MSRIAALKPDLIVATNAGVDADTYQQLSAVRLSSGGDAFFSVEGRPGRSAGAVFAADRMGR